MTKEVNKTKVGGAVAKPADQQPLSNLSIKQQYNNAVEALNKLKALFYDESAKMNGIKSSMAEIQRAISYQDGVTKNLYNKMLADRKGKKE